MSSRQVDDTHTTVQASPPLQKSRRILSASSNFWIRPVIIWNSDNRVLIKISPPAVCDNLMEMLIAMEKLVAPIICPFSRIHDVTELPTEHHIVYLECSRWNAIHPVNELPLNQTIRSKG
ncbi:hypothetical protein PUN28_002785 [Cardiocondyla obscurior]|uniref:Uncharacterized protein n=1 Tax=Cardiocondyla obscurior TaxID=286306 RepID=A0AAW2GWE1_9HYME